MKRRLVRLACTVILAAAAPARIQMRTHLGAAAGDQFGWAVAGVGDVDGDGAGDLAIGAPTHDAAAGVDAGRVTVISGRTGLAIRVWDGPGAHDFFGQAIAGAGDLDGDGFADVLVGAPEADKHPTFFGNDAAYGAGYARVISGATGSALLDVAGTSNGQCTGVGVATGGDIDGDGVTELLIGQPGGAGQVRIVSGATGATLRTVPGAGTFGGFGHALAFLGDFDGDGADEYAIGAYESLTSVYPGRVRAYDGATGAQLWEVEGDGPDDEFGISLARLGDRDGDSRSEVIVGARQDAFPSPVGPGYVEVLSGATGALIQRFSGTTYACALGFSVAAIGDIDGDGLEDLAASQPGADDFGYAIARPLRVFADEPLQQIFNVPHASTGNFFGLGLGSADVTGDGLRDLVIGEPRADTGGTNSGRVFVYTAVRSPTSYCAAETNSLGCVPYVAGIGTPSASSPQPFRVKAFDVLNDKFGLLFYGFAPQAAPFQGGTLCVAAPVRRTPIQDSGGNAGVDDCSGLYSFDFNDHIRSGADPTLVAGEEVFAQYWSRDPASASTTNLTDALAFAIGP